MARSFSRLVVVLALLAFPAPALASEIGWPTPELWASADGGDAFQVPLEVALNADGKTYTGMIPQVQTASFGFEGALRFDPDPFVQYSFGVTNFTAGPLDFTFLFLTPVVDGPYNTLKSRHSSVVADGGTVPDGNVTVAPFGGALVHRPQIDGVETAVGHIGNGCVVAARVGFCDSGSGTFAIGPVSPSTLGVTVAFTLSPGDSYSTSGRVDLLARTRITTQRLAQVPAPATIGLLGAALAMLAARHRARRRASPRADIAR